MEGSEPLSCPHCPGLLRPVAARARSGYLIEIDQCPACGGIWCDQWELFPIAPHEALRLDPVDEKRLRGRAAPAAEPGRCPRCRIPLRRFQDPALPAEARIERCRVCQGMWLNRGELARVKGASGAQRAPSKTALDRIAATCSGDMNWPLVQDLDAALDAPPDPDIGVDEARALVRAAAGWGVLRLLLRLLFRV
jgi:Zn-finger nucleic acid-binding protein